jgi:hypothetical protein
MFHRPVKKETLKISRITVVQEKSLTIGTEFPSTTVVSSACQLAYR